MTEHETSPQASPPQQTPSPRWWLHGVLFALTCLTTWWSGIMFAGGEPFTWATYEETEVVWQGAGYSFFVLLILFAHEMGHYLKARQHEVEVSPPYFLFGIPVPPWGAVLPFMGTFGAVIQMQLKRLKAKKLLEIGAWGPVAGFIVTVPVLFVGYALSEVRPLPENGEGTMQFGYTLLMWLGEKLFFPDIPPGHDVFMHPIAVAGWVGVLLTAINLLPLGQLDGGHIAYTVFGERFNRVAPWLLGALALAGLALFPGWLLMAAIVWKIGAKHPPMMKGEPVRGARDTWLAWASLAIFVLTFTPQPIVLKPTPIGWLMATLFG